MSLWQGVVVDDRIEPALGRWAEIPPSDQVLRWSIGGVLFGPSVLLVVALALVLSGERMNALLVLVVCFQLGFFAALHVAVIARELSRRRRGEAARKPDFDWRDTGNGKAGHVPIVVVAAALVPFIYCLLYAALLLLAEDNIGGAIAVTLTGIFMLIISLQLLYLRRREL